MDIKKDEKENIIKRYLNVLPTHEIFQLKKFLLEEISYHVQWSFDESVYTFFISELNETHLTWLWPYLNSSVEDYLEINRYENTSLKVDRFYVNCHPSHHPGDWHDDGPEGITVLYYPDVGLDYGNEGGLEFEDYPNQVYIPNSLLIFPRSIFHKAQIHRNIGQLRFSLAIKISL